jgi:hypothetical protein
MFHLNEFFPLKTKRGRVWSGEIWLPDQSRTGETASLTYTFSLCGRDGQVGQVETHGSFMHDLHMSLIGRSRVKCVVCARDYPTTRPQRIL